MGGLRQKLGSAIAAAACAAGLAGCASAVRDAGADEIAQIREGLRSDRLKAERRLAFYPSPRQRVIVQLAAQSALGGDVRLRLVNLRRNSRDDDHFDFCAEAFRLGGLTYVNIFGEYRGDKSFRVTATGAHARRECAAKVN